MNSVRRLSCLCLATIMTLVASPDRAMAWDADDLGRRASWMPVAPETAQEQITSWLETLELPADQKQQLLSLWHDAGQLPPTELHSRFIETARQVDQRIDELVDRCQGPWRPESEALPEVLSDSQLPTWVRSNLRLYYASWLAHHQLYNELHQTLDGVLLNEVFDPGALLFFQSVGQHRRLERDACLATLRKLLENEATLPQRYVKLAKLMQADLEPLKPDSLDEISRIMDNIQVTLGHGRAGKLVRTDEETVVSKLDKLIKQLEDQASAAAAAASSSSNGNPNTPSKPMEDSMNAELKGPGNVSPKDLGAKTDWGNLPPKEREEALQALGRDLPSHYRDVIEEYFRKLAREKEE